MTSSMGGSRLKLCFGWRLSGRKQFEQELGNVADLVELLKELKYFSQRKKFYCWVLLLVLMIQEKQTSLVLVYDYH
jgi:hypothetical protein